ncbi:MAG: hypothetical protein OEU84_15105 [Xanthomonadales bacterium]|jgi:hypothetical protein|nr:hypothetical protein [Xanthomonadales bacterium]MDH4020921.1 hypothetical protein [Xanthomonadales bacterium]
MFGIPSDIDLSKIIGQFTTQIRIGKYDFQFDLGDVSFCIYSPIKVLKDEQLHAAWKEGSWPDSGFLEIFNVPVSGFEIPDDRTIIIEFENGLEMYRGPSVGCCPQIFDYKVIFTHPGPGADQVTHHEQPDLAFSEIPFNLASNDN